MCLNDLPQETWMNSETASNLELNTKQQATVDAELLADLYCACKMSWTMRETEIVALVLSEIDKPLLTKSVRDALKAEDLSAVGAPEKYSRIA